MDHEITLPPCVIDLSVGRDARVRARSDIGEEHRMRWRHFVAMHGGERVAKGTYAFADAIDVLDFIEHARESDATIRPARKVGDVLERRADGVAETLDALDARVDALPHPLRPYQRAGAEFLATRTRAHIYDDMGLGKTIQALAALPGGAPVLVVCPASMRLTWQREGELWRPDIHWVAIEKLGDLRPPAAGEGVIVSPIAACELGSPPPDTLMICDEAHFFKNPKAKRSTAIGDLARSCAGAWALTGTPQTNDPSDLKGLLSVFGVFQRAFGTAHCFGAQHGERWDMDQRRTIWPPHPPHPGAIVRSLERVAIRRTREQVLEEIPSMQYATIHVDVRDDGMVKMPSESDLADMLEVARAIDHGGIELVPKSVMANVSAARAMLAKAKIPHMLAFADQHLATGHPLVIASANNDPLKALWERGHPVITGAVNGPDRARIVDRFQSGLIPVLGINILAAGVGLTLHRAHHMLMVQREWTPSANAQVEARIRRYGQRNACVVYDLVANHPLDERISTLIREKQDRINETVNRVGSSIRYGRDLEMRLREVARYAKKT